MNKKDFKRIIRIINKLDFMTDVYEEGAKILNAGDVEIFGKYWRWNHYVDFGYFVKKELHCDFKYFESIIEKDDYNVVKDFVTNFSLKFNELEHELCDDGRRIKNVALDIIKSYKKSKNLNIDDLNLVLNAINYCDVLVKSLFLSSGELFDIIDCLAAKKRAHLCGAGSINKYVSFNCNLV